MNCPACGSPDSKVTRSIDDGLAVKRQRECAVKACRQRFTSTELMDRVVLPVAIGSHSPAAGGQLTRDNNETPLPVAISGQKLLNHAESTGNPPSLSTRNHDSHTAQLAIAASRASVSGSGPGLVPSRPAGPDLSQPIRENAEDLTRARGPVYSAGFVAFWAAYPSKVGKDDAWRVWQKKKPPLDAVLAALAWQVVSERWQAGYVPNPATYLNQGRWRDEPRRAALDARTAASVSAGQEWLLEASRDRK